MPIKIPDSLPATAVLESENIFVMTEYRAMHQDIRPLNVLILNLMPTKVITENQLLRKLSNTPLQIKVEFLQTASYTPQHVDTQHMESFYTTFEQVKDRWFDGLIITGAPLAFVPYEKVHYWKELCTIMDWAKTHVHSTMHICWGALAGLYYHFGIPTVEYPEKLSGVYPNTVLKQSSPLFRGFDDVFLAPHSREVGILKKDVDKVPELELIATIQVKMRVLPRTSDEKTLAIGQKAAWFTGSPYFVNMVQGGGLYGFDGIRRTAELMAEAFIEEKDTEDLVVRKGWGCESCI